jgi:endoglucanase
MGSEDILAEHLIDERYARIALHPDDTAVPPYPGWCSGCDDFDLLGSWADAGDFGIYTVNHAISAWTLLNLHELFPEAFTDGELNIPESGNSFPDILDEVDYGSRFVRGMLPSDGGLASHKAHNHAWSAFTITIEAENSQNGAGTRSAMGSSTPATFAVARVNAQLARMWHTQGNDAAYVTVLWDAAEDAWDRAFGTSKTYNPSEASPGPAVGGGDYPDSQISDDEYAAACEMYLTALALGSTSDAASYKSIVTSSSHFGQTDQWDWAMVAGAGTLSLYAVDNDLSESQKKSIENSIVGFADKIKQAIDQEGYPSNLNFSELGQYPWGSNSFIVNRMIALAYAHEITGDISYQKYLLRSMDYVMGTNAMDISYVTGYGEKDETDTHDRWAWTIGQDSFWPRGWLSGGPNNELVNDYETPVVAAAKSYAAKGTAPHAWGSKENTVNWNSPLAWVAWYIEHKIVPQLGGCGGNCAPIAESYSAKVQMNDSASLTLQASDYDGSISSWAITEQPKLGSLSGTAPNLVYTPNINTRGVDTFSFIVTDNNGQSSGVATVTLTIRDCNYLDIFQVPSNYPPLTVSYNYVHVSEDGPDFGNTRTPFHKVQVNTNLDQFVMEFDESPYYLDLKQCMPASTVSSPASISLSGCGISGLDGDYWIRQDNGNSIWVEKNNGWAIVFTNDANLEPEFCRSDGPPPSVSGAPTARPSPKTTMAPVTPSPNGSGPSTDRPTSDPTKKPTKAPSAKPTPPTTGGNTCCTNRNLGYQSCDTNSWCNQSESNCNTCGGIVMAVPLERDGCCTWGGDCSSWNPDNNMGCQYMKNDCENDCGGTWQFF